MLYSIMKLCAVFMVYASILMADEPTNSNDTLIDFSKHQASHFNKVTDDGVMGGMSKGQVTQTEQGSALFQGRLSLENNGGFSSWEIQRGKWDLSEYKGIQLRVKGDGRTYKLRLATTEKFRFSPVAFQMGFKTIKGEWTTVKVPFSELKASWRGRSLENVFDPKKVRRMGIILADKNEGPFSIEVSQLTGWN